MSIQVSSARIKKFFEDGNVKAVGSIVLNEEFVIHDVRVVEGSRGLFVAMPSKKLREGEYTDIAHPITNHTREIIQNVMLEAYQQKLKENDDTPASV